MAGREINEDFSEDYKNTVFSIWYNRGTPKIGKLIDFLDPDETGRLPAPKTIQRWREKDGWDGRAEQLNIEVQQQTDRKLVAVRMNMMKRHAEIAQETQEMAYAYLKDTGFDSSASAVSALFKAFDEEKKSRGMEVALTQVFSMNDEDLQKTMNKLLARANGIGEDDEVVTGDVEEVDAAGDTQTTDE